MQGRPEGVAYPTQHLPAGRLPLWGPSLHFAKPAGEPFKTQIGAGNSAAYNFRVSPDCVTWPQGPASLYPCLTSSALPLTPYLLRGHRDIMPGPKQVLTDSLSGTQQPPILVYEATWSSRRRFFQEAFPDSQSPRPRSWLLLSQNPGLSHC